MSHRPVGFSSPNRFLVYAHESEPTFYPEEVHDAIQVCIPFPNARYTVHRHSTTGKGIVSHLGSRDVLVIPAGQPHGVSWHRPAAIVSLLIDQAFVAEALEGRGLELGDGLTFRDPFLSAAGRRLWDSMSTESISRTMVDSLATLIVHGINEQVSKSLSKIPQFDQGTPLSHHQLYDVQDFVDSRIGDEITIESMARHLKMSVWHFGRRLRASTGMSPHAFLMDRRFMLAQHLLKNTSASILEVAIGVGMTHSHFSRSFRSRFGISPSDFRKR